MVSVKTHPNKQADIDGNGTIDYWFDANADGRFEMAVLDTSGNRVFERRFFIRENRASSHLGTANENSLIEYLPGVDKKDGKVSWIVSTRTGM